ncbi:transposase [Psychrosphaera algicola]|uniref:Transposase n=1 Tax=Psychrosphaera algicola TaxID=3023714 RepID=A0ABT5FFB5_9GAMM|nr:transposase [Psychrosphaera sp. G1-22]MDC2889734.1 transposase [Psychrosphaera sp. G1-22]
MEYSLKFKVDVHAWVLMTNHVHILCTPRFSNGVSLMMQSLGRRYVPYFNKKYNRSGTLWEGRYKTCLIQEEKYLMELYRYIELNPVRAKITNDPANYLWSSYQINGLGKVSKLCSPHPLYLRLGDNKFDRLKAYREIFRSHVDGPLLHDIREALNKSMALGSERFKLEVETLTGRRVMEGKRGRPIKIHPN